MMQFQATQRTCAYAGDNKNCRGKYQIRSSKSFSSRKLNQRDGMLSYAGSPTTDERHRMKTSSYQPRRWNILPRRYRHHV
ncbi:hypothetical protein GQ600_8408 [Phytophthora cactorum]|nr:hypothetical protein GQ600_8408 [Phytophthora cactorum]